MSDIGDRIRLIREQLGMTQGEFGVLVGIDQRQISRYECGREEPSLGILRRIARGLGITVGELLDEEGQGGGDA